jgi:hypothetical protein
MNYFSAADLIQAKLTEHLAAASLNCHVAKAAGWKHLLESLQMTPACFIWHQADKIQTNQSGSRGLGKNQIVDQIWNVVVAVRNVGDASGYSAQLDADAIISAVLALQGDKLDSEHGHLYRAQSQYMSGYVKGFGIYPFAFSTRIFT